MRKLLRKAGQYLIAHTKEPLPPARKTALQEWFGKNGDKTLRLNYDLHANSIVFDLGGYEGQWASDVYCKYRSKIFVFEPSRIYCDRIAARFTPNADIEVFQFGLGNKNSEEKLYLQSDGSSIHVDKQGGKFEVIVLKDANEFLRQQSISAIDLIKINIEGGEYDLLEHLINTGWIHKIKNVQVQFHDFVDNADTRMKKIQVDLSKTHELTYQYEFVWENWRLK